MASPVIAVRKAALTRIGDAITEQVLDAAPIRYTLPYVTFQRCFISERQRINKTTELWVIGITFDVVGYPHDEGAKTVNDLADEVDEAMDANLTLTGLTVSDQIVSNLEVFEDIDEDGAELKRASITWDVTVI